MIKIKKLLTSLAAIGLVATTASTVVSCVSIEQVTNRTIDTSVYKSTFTNNIQNWNIAATMQSADFKILSNLEDTLLTFSGTKENPNPQPQILSEVPELDTSDNSYTLKISDAAKWFDISTGKEVTKITANDIANTARYTLNAKNLSEQKSPWTSIVRGAQKYADYLSNNPNAGDENFIVDDTKSTNKTVDENTGLEIIDNKTIKIYLTGPAHYFQTMLMTGAFAPTPDVALSEGKDYGRNGYADVLTSGPFYVSSYSPSYLMEFKRNPNYKTNSKGTINTIRYYYSSSSDAAHQRALWETGDVTESILSPTDLYAKNKYENFEGTERVSNNLVGSKYLWFNFSKQQNDKDGPNEGDKRSNMALSLKSVRSLIAFGMNRAKLVQYFAGTDDKKVVYSYLTNSFNPANWLFSKKGDKDSEYIKNYLSGKHAGFDNLIDTDAYHHNIHLLDDEGVDSLEGLILKVKDDLKANHIEGKVTLDFLTSGVNQKTFNPYIRLMIQDFDDIPNNPLNIREEATTDDAQYQVRQTDGNFSMFITGETPTYTDPMSFLNDLRINGAMDAYDGLSRLYDKSGKNMVGKNTYNVSEELNEDMTKITNELESANALPDDKNSLDARYKAFGQAEANILYNYKNIIPLYTPNGENIDYLTYVKYDSRPNVGYGYNDYRLDKVELAKSVKELINNSWQKPDKNTKAIVKEN